MKRTKTIFFLAFMLTINCVCVSAQTLSKKVILSIEGEKVFIDATSMNTRIRDSYNVYTEGGYFIHPVTQKRIRKDQEVIGRLEITAVYSDYCEAKAIPQSSLSKMKIGMEVRKIDRTGITEQAIVNNDTKIPVVIAPAQINDVVNNGYFGGYTADILMEHLINNNNIRLLDRSVLNAQMDESNLQGDYIDPATAIQRGKIVGAQYIIQLTMQKPDVVNLKTGVPLNNIVGAIAGLTNTNLYSQYLSNTRISTLKASVTMSARVIDMQTGEVVFMCSASGNATGRGQVSLEAGALGGMQVNGGAEGFKQTVTGQAMEKAFAVIGKSLNDHFNGKTQAKLVDNAHYITKNNNNILKIKNNKLFKDDIKLKSNDVEMLFHDNLDLLSKYKKARNPLPIIGYTAVVTIPLSVILFSTMHDIYFNGGNPDSNDTALYAIVMSGTSLISGVIFSKIINYRRKKKLLGEIVNDYNSSLSQSNINTHQSSLDLSLTTTGKSKNPFGL